MTWRVLEGDCVDVLRGMGDASVDAIVTDPPYGLGFMGKDWDSPGGTGNYPMRRTAAVNTVNTGASRQGGRQRASEDWHKRQARDARAFQEWCESWGREALRVLRPGGYLLAFGGTRTYHRLVSGLEDAGFEIRDEVLSAFEATDAGRQFLASLSGEQIAALDALGGGPLAWLYGSGFPKSLDVSKAIDKAAGAEREIVGEQPDRWTQKGSVFFTTGRPRETVPITGAPATPEAAQWEGWGTALKPAHEPIVVARKPLAGTVAQNVLEHGTGALNIDGCRIATTDAPREQYEANGLGRWPANVVLAHTEDCRPAGTREVASNGHFPARRPAGSQVSGPSGHAGQDGLVERHTRGEVVEVWECAPGCPVRMLDEQQPTAGAAAPVKGTERSAAVEPGAITGARARVPGAFHGDSGGASRFFYCAKASTAERNAGLDDFPLRERPAWSSGTQNPGSFQEGNTGPTRNIHPTVKPIGLMRWLVRLVTPPGGLVLDPFAGSGTTGIAAVLEGFEFVGVERDPEYARIARARVGWWAQHPEGVSVEAALAAHRQRRATADAGQLDLLADAAA